MLPSEEPEVTPDLRQHSRRFAKPPVTFFALPDSGSLIFVEMLVRLREISGEQPGRDA
jgi:hypothetical protein